ncbi:MAG TPA: hypothetical protein VFI30_00780, partial [Nocardioidaceae bacterium]|nr:hypothetical protein [Nocardioidaceae bacterium]
AGFDSPHYGGRLNQRPSRRLNLRPSRRLNLRPSRRLNRQAPSTTSGGGSMAPARWLGRQSVSALGET